MTNPAPGGISLKMFLSVFGVLAVLGAAAGGYGALQTTVSANAENLNDIEDRVDRIENRAGDVRERLTGIEVLQKEQSKTLERILKAVER